uniref:KNTC1 second ARM-repeats domain-containing protein n=1 Tax=Eptatretus burgeri TaxID=7764 RepID=A0A8C4Q0M0_EPTBU
MLKAVVPWSKAMEQLVQKYLHMEHPKVKLLQESYQFMEIKELLRGYGLRNLNLAVDQDTQTLVMFILKKDLASSFKDAMKVVKMYHIPPEPIYLYRMIQLVLSERGEESLELLYSLSVSMALSTGRRFVSRVMIELEYPLYLKDPTLTDNLETRETLLTRHCVQVLTFMVAHTDDHTRSELKQQLHTLDSIAKLQNNFKVFLSCSKYDDHTCRHALLTSTIGAFFTNPTDESIPAPHGNGPRHGPILCSSLEKLVYFGSLLSFEEVEVVGEIVLHAFSLGKVEMGLRLCRALPESHRGDGVARVLMSAGLTLCKMLERDELVEVSSDLNLPLEILELSRLALCFCSPDQLLECAELCDIARIAAAVYEQCQTEDLLLSDKTLGANVDQFVYETFAFEDEFKEDSIVLNASQTIPVVYEITNIIGPQLPHIGE